MVVPEENKDSHIPQKKFEIYIKGLGIDEWSLNYEYEDFFND